MFKILTEKLREDK